MALHSKLPIYRQTYTLLTQISMITRNFPRDIKQLVGKELLSDCVKMTTLIFRANAATQKVRHIQALREQVQAVDLMLRMSCDMRWITPKQYASLITLTDSIGRQATGWKQQSSNSRVG